MKKTFLVLSSILILAACSTPAAEETTTTEATVDSTVVDSLSLEAETDTAAVK
jgi:hypothetical protein